MMSDHPTPPIHDPMLATTGNSFPVTIRRARPGDVRAVAAIQRASFRRGLAYGMGALFTLWLVPSVAFFVAIDVTSGRVVGCGIADRTRDSTRVMNLAVDPNFRRRGVGRQLLTALETTFPHSDVLLMVEEWNTGAQALYETNGFIQLGVNRHYYGRNQHGIRMKKPRSGATPLSDGHVPESAERPRDRITVPRRAPRLRSRGEAQYQDHSDNETKDTVQDRRGT